MRVYDFIERNKNINLNSKVKHDYFDFLDSYVNPIFEYMEKFNKEMEKTMKKKVKIFTSNYEEGLIETISQDVLDMFDEILLMPDTHIGKSVPIGFVGKFTNKIIPEIVGVDIGCGMLACPIPKEYIPEEGIDFKGLEEHITKHIPTGSNIHEEESKNIKWILDNLTFELSQKDRNRILRSSGTLGGGNHFIEIVENDGNYVLIIHSGSRSLGLKVCEHHQNKLNKDKDKLRQIRENIIKTCKKENRPQDIQSELANIDPALYEKTYLEGDDLYEYLKDMDLAQKYASYNRYRMMIIIMKYFDANGDCFMESDIIDTPHNYIDLDNNIIHKGSISAKKGEKVIIPLNMRDGVIFGEGIGNEEWLSSAPHGAGRKLSRTQARKELNMEDFKEQMSEVNTFSICEGTIDEAPGAYKDFNQLLEDVKPTIKNVVVMKPVYNFKDKGSVSLRKDKEK